MGYNYSFKCCKSQVSRVFFVAHLKRYQYQSPELKSAPSAAHLLHSYRRYALWASSPSLCFCFDPIADCWSFLLLFFWFPAHIDSLLCSCCQNSLKKGYKQGETMTSTRVLCSQASTYPLWPLLTQTYMTLGKQRAARNNPCLVLLQKTQTQR